jgi:ABC-type uncharacterized transport system substrate-binding protein
VKRRQFITLLGGAAATWPLAARAQQSTMPVIGYLASNEETAVLAAFHQGLNETGFVQNRNVAIEYRWSADGDKIAAFAAEMVAHRVALIVSVSAVATAHAIKASAGTIPIVFGIGPDPVKLGFVATPHATAVYASCSALLPPHATLASRRPAMALPGPDLHRLDRTSLRLAHLLDDLVGAHEQR